MEIQLSYIPRRLVGLCNLLCVHRAYRAAEQQSNRALCRSRDTSLCCLGSWSQRTSLLSDLLPEASSQASTSSSSGQSSRSDHTSPQPVDSASKNLSWTPGSYEKTVDLPSVNERSTNVDKEMGSVLRTSDTAPQRVILPPASANELSKGTSPDPGSVSLIQSIEQPRFPLVDDNTINLRMLEMFVKKCGIPSASLASVNGGQEAIAAFGKALFSNCGTAPSFDIILMDLTMPEVSGFSATRSIRRIEEASNIGQQAYIVALTSLVSSKDRSAAYEAGGNHQHVMNTAILGTQLISGDRSGRSSQTSPALCLKVG
jgi:CheY-like chemotaxis protein